MSELDVLRAEVRRLEGSLKEQADEYAEEIRGLEEEAAILELGWSRLDMDLYTPSFLLSRPKEVMPVSK